MSFVCSFRLVLVQQTSCSIAHQLLACPGIVEWVLELLVVQASRDLWPDVPSPNECSTPFYNAWTHQKLVGYRFDTLYIWPLRTVFTERRCGESVSFSFTLSLLQNKWQDNIDLHCTHTSKSNTDISWKVNGDLKSQSPDPVWTGLLHSLFV